MTGVLAVAAALIGLGSASALACPAVLRPSAATGASAAKVVQRVPTLEERLVTAINELRVARGLVPLRLNRQLASTAAEHSLSMAEQGYFEHSSPTGTPFWFRIETKYSPRGGYWRVGENLAWASPRMTAKLALDLWLKSPEHRKNMLNAAWRDIGIGGVYVHPAPGVFQGLSATIVTADFGVRR